MNESCMNDKCNANSWNEFMSRQNQIWCGTPMECNCKATTNVFHNQRCAYLCFPWPHLSSPLEDTPCDVVGFAVTTSTTIAEIRTALVSKGYSIGWPALRCDQRQRARTQSSSQSTNWKSK